MIRTIALEQAVIEYTIRRHPRARRTGLTLYPDGKLVVTLTPIALERTAERFIRQKQEWIIRNLQLQRSKQHVFLPKLTTASIEKLREQSRSRASELLSKYNAVYRFSFNRVAIKNHKKQWGSCSHKKNLNFNLRLALLPEAIASLIVVHELCHLQEMNHSGRFWQLVARTVPNYKKLERELKRYVIT